jgi:hypothetical protein
MGKGAESQTHQWPVLTFFVCHRMDVISPLKFCKGLISIVGRTAVRSPSRSFLLKLENFGGDPEWKAQEFAQAIGWMAQNLGISPLFFDSALRLGNMPPLQLPGSEIEDAALGRDHSSPEDTTLSMDYPSSNVNTIIYPLA